MINFVPILFFFSTELKFFATHPLPEFPLVMSCQCTHRQKSKGTILFPESNHACRLSNGLCSTSLPLPNLQVGYQTLIIPTKTTMISWLLQHQQAQSDQARRQVFRILEYVLMLRLDKKNSTVEFLV